MAKRCNRVRRSLRPKDHARRITRQTIQTEKHRRDQDPQQRKKCEDSSEQSPQGLRYSKPRHGANPATPSGMTERAGRALPLNNAVTIASRSNAAAALRRNSDDFPQGSAAM